jgi:hypothetical protein
MIKDKVAFFGGLKLGISCFGKKVTLFSAPS